MFTIEPLKQCTLKNTTHTNGNCLREITRSILFIFGYSIRAVFLFVIRRCILANCKSIDERPINCWFFFTSFFFYFFLHIQKSCILYFMKFDFVWIQFQCIYLYVAWLITMPNIVFLFDLIFFIYFLFSQLRTLSPSRINIFSVTCYLEWMFVCMFVFSLCSSNLFYCAYGFVVCGPFLCLNGFTHILFFIYDIDNQ